MANLRPAAAAAAPLLRHCAPRHHLFTRLSPQRHPPSQSQRYLSRSTVHRKDEGEQVLSSFGIGPSPPRLPKEDQDIFDALQRQSTGAFSTPRAPPKINQSPDSTPAEESEAQAETSVRAEKIGEQGQQQSFQDEFKRVIEARGKGEELHPNVRRGAQPEFEGDVNPKTGEVGGPKNEPLRWGAAGEWSYNGRTTDF